MNRVLGHLVDDAWLGPAAGARVRARIRAIEQRTDAELVVTVAPASGRYRGADALFGACCSLLVLLFYYFHPARLVDEVWLAAAVLGYPAGMLFCAAVPPLRRWLARERWRRANVRREARARFVDQGIANTKRRTGVLVFVSRFERAAEVVADRGVPIETMGRSWVDAVADVARAVRPRGIEDFLGALDRLGEVLAAAVPHTADDVNELPDEVRS